jgi:hypothetical protein
MTKVSSRPAFDVSALAESAVQFRLRNGGSGSAGSSAYIQATRALAGWARGQGQSPLVHALVHLGWTSTSGARKTVAASSSKAWPHAATLLEVGEDAGEAVVRVLTALKEAGAPEEALATVWATFTATA